MLTHYRHGKITWVLIVSVFSFALMWSHHQVEHLDSSHDEIHCSLCISLDKLATGICSSTIVLAIVSGVRRATPAIGFLISANRLTACARSPPFHH